ncbi:MAG: DUF1499 domain-containing protein [Beijerinckiaceae bacterium]
MRHYILEEPYSQTAIWARRLAIFALVLGLIGLLLIRTNTVEMAAGMAVFGASILFACVALLMAAAAGVVIWRTGRKGILPIVTAILLSLLFLVYPGFLAARAVQLPLINDISTDVNDPPKFSQSAKAKAARPGATHPEALAGALQQQSAYSDIQPIVIDLEAEEVWELVQDTVKELGWKIIEESPPRDAKPAQYSTVRERRGRRTVNVRKLAAPAQTAGEGRLEAVSRSLIMGFPDDVTIRIRALEAQTRIDVRSASRFGRHDFGANAARIRRFAAELQGQLDAQ